LKVVMIALTGTRMAGDYREVTSDE
jgi:hypothetical protein